MAKLTDLMEGRNQGLAMALKIAKEGGIEALEKEIKYRNITGISLNLTKQEIEDASWKTNVRATSVAITISLVTLLEEFSFSRYQLTKFKAAFDSKVYEAANNERSMDILQEYIDMIHKDAGIEIIIGD